MLQSWQPAAVCTTLVQAEVFSALRSPPQGDELQLLSKLHKVWRSDPSMPCIT